MSDLKKYVAERKKRDREFAEGFDVGYAQFKIGATLRKAREAALGNAAPEKALDGLRDNPPQGAESPFEPMFVFPGKTVEELVKDCVEGGPLWAPGTVELRGIKSW